MKLSATFLAFSLIALVVSSPIAAKRDKGADQQKSKGQIKAAATGGGSASVLKSQTFNDISVSDGTAGNALEEVNKLFSGIDMNDLASVSLADLEIIKNTHNVAHQAEVEAFNPAIKAASGAEAKALKNGKIANKVLKTVFTVLELQIQIARGIKIEPAKLAEEQKKMQTNIDLDKAAAGQPMKGVKFDGVI
ncbi:hypothetical protein K3495_g6488 [Podosphaera aphanis]|nr:hypothetical protein K3495_g6488 [Podosphaera aphanis]